MRSPVEYEVTPQDIEDYRGKGYWISPQLIDEDRIQELREAVERLFRGERDGRGWYFDETGIKEPEDPHALSPFSRS